MGQGPEPNEIPLEIEIELSPDRMEATLSARPAEGLELRSIQQALTAALKKAGVRFGLVPEALKEAAERLAKGEEVQRLVVARGLAPKPGEDAHIEVLVKLEPGLVGTMRKGGRIDFRHKGPLPIVTPGTALAKLHPAVAGAPGKDVTARVVRPEPVLQLRLRAGKGTELTDKGQVVVATVEGMVSRPAPNRFEVHNILDVPGDVDYSTGHISFPGLVRVRGVVKQGFRVRAGALEAGGLEPGSVADIDEDVVVHGGIMGAAVRAGGSLVARHMRDSRVVCRGDVNVHKEIINTRLQSAGSVNITAADGRIVNSYIGALRGITTTHIQSTHREATVLRMGVRPEFEARMYRLKRAAEKLHNQILHLTEALEAQREELAATEKELKEILLAYQQAPQGPERDNLMAQIKMIKPLRATLQEGMATGTRRLEKMESRLKQLREQVRKMMELVSGRGVRIIVKGDAEPGTMFRGSRSSVILEEPKSYFMVEEALVDDHKLAKKRWVLIFRSLHGREQ